MPRPRPRCPKRWLIGDCACVCACPACCCCCCRSSRSTDAVVRRCVIVCEKSMDKGSPSCAARCEVAGTALDGALLDCATMEWWSAGRSRCADKAGSGVSSTSAGASSSDALLERIVRFEGSHASSADMLSCGRGTLASQEDVRNGSVCAAGTEVAGAAGADAEARAGAAAVCADTACLLMR
jgi:hypothetical protein